MNNQIYISHLFPLLNSYTATVIRIHMVQNPEAEEWTSQLHILYQTFFSRKKNEKIWRYSLLTIGVGPLHWSPPWSPHTSPAASSGQRSSPRWPSPGWTQCPPCRTWRSAPAGRCRSTRRTPSWCTARPGPCSRKTKSRWRCFPFTSWKNIYFSKQKDDKLIYMLYNFWYVVLSILKVCKKWPGISAKSEERYMPDSHADFKATKSADQLTVAALVSW